MTGPAMSTNGVRIATRDPDRRRAERVMGTVASLVVPDGGAGSATVDRTFGWLHEVDRRFSPFRADSEVSRLMRGEVDPASASADLAEVLELCEVVERLSDGVFDIRGHRADGAPDPTGVVKGWAVDRAAAILLDGGIERFCIGAGGDVVVRGGRTPVEPWRIGVVDPTDRAKVILTLEAYDLAVATSGRSERGEHVVDAHTGRASDDLWTLTVAGPMLGHADAYATAAFGMGRHGLRWCASLPGYAACAVTAERRLLLTSGMARYVRADMGGSRVPTGQTSLDRRAAEGR
jgi:thiamine biosynthesis lipoprotein